MTFEIDDDIYPFTAVVYITARWGNQVFTGSGVLVGQNDVLTAGHVVFDQTLGGFADEVLIYPSYDPDDTNNLSFSYRYGEYFPDFDPDGDGRLFTGDFDRTTLSDSEIDIALLATSEAIGETYGWFGIDYGFTGGAVAVAGHPGIYGTQPSYDTGTVSLGSGGAVYLIDPSLEVNSGNSGGPIFYETEEGPFVVGVVSTRIAAAAVGAHQDWIPASIQDNDRFLDSPVSADDDQVPPWYNAPPASILGSAASERLDGSAAEDVAYGFGGDDTLAGAAGRDFLVGGPGEDRLLGGGGDDVLIGGGGFDAFDGGGGTDTSVYWFTRADYGLSRSGSDFVIGFSDGGTETHRSVERFEFEDGTLAFDIDGAAGAAYRLYQAAFARTPDPAGVGFWTRSLDAGVSLNGAANNFIRSNEFKLRYGEDTSDRDYVETLFLNVLGRPGAERGIEFWTGRLEADTPRNEVLVAFSEGPENQAGVLPDIEDGIWFV